MQAEGVGMREGLLISQQGHDKALATTAGAVTGKREEKQRGKWAHVHGDR